MYYTMKISLTFFIAILTSFFLKAQISQDYAVMVQAVVSESPASITLKFNHLPRTKQFRIYKKTKSANSWGTPIVTLPSNTTQYIDNTVLIGNAYEYHIVRYDSSSTAYGYIYAGIKLPETTYRGKLLLMVDANYSTPLLTEIAQLQNDLIADGWQVKRFDISRSATVKSVKSIIQNEVAADANTKALYLLGRIPVPYSGVFDTLPIVGNPDPSYYYAPDGHWQHSGAWASDMYYGVLNETIWTDNLNDTLGTRSQNKNIPGDGKFDKIYIYSDTVALQIGRVDLTNMPSFGMSDTLLVKQYLNKAHNFKTGQLNIARKGLVYDNFGALGGEAFSSTGWRDFTTMFGDSVFNKSYLSGIKQGNYLFSYGCGAGNYNSCQGIGFSNVFNSDSINTVFTMLFGSFFGDWDSQDNFLRAPLCSRPSALASMWSGRPHWHTHHMSLGENIGYSTRLTQNNYYDTTAGVIGYNYNNYPTFIHISLMGDPTLRLHPMKAVTNVKITPTSPDAALGRISWTPSSDATDGYVILNSRTIDGKFTIVGYASSTDTSYNYINLGHSMFYYLVRAKKLENTPSGTYYNLSLGGYDSVNITHVIGVDEHTKIQLDASITPNPNNGKFTVLINGNFSQQAMIDCYDMTGRLLKHLISNANNTEMNLDGYTGLVVVKIILGDMETTKKVLLLE